jgi:broad specificity phosphatase PhoE
MAVQLILVRHGQPDVPTSGRTGNPPLSKRGFDQAEHAAAVLKHEAINRIISSGMIRADSTAKPLADALGLNIELHPHLGEVDRNGGDYASIEAIKEKGHGEWRRFLSSPLAYFGVDPDQFRNETLNAFRNVMNGSNDQRIAIFTHGFPINILLSHALGLNDDARFVPTYASITRVAGKSFDALTVVSVNESGHIPEELK